jgi:hypothetical protein
MHDNSDTAALTPPSHALLCCVGCLCYHIHGNLLRELLLAAEVDMGNPLKR